MRARRPSAGARCAKASRAVVAATTSAAAASLSPISHRAAVRRMSANSQVRGRAAANPTSASSGHASSSREEVPPGPVSGRSANANRSSAAPMIADRANGNSAAVNPRGASLANARSVANALVANALVANGLAAGRRPGRAGRVAMTTAANGLHVPTAPNVLLTESDRPPVPQDDAPASAATDLNVRRAAIAKPSAMWS